MLGNLAELCSTYYLDKLTPETIPIFSPARPEARVTGCRRFYCSPPEYLHVAFRNAFTGTQTPHVGMRLVLRQGEGLTHGRERDLQCPAGQTGCRGEGPR